MTDDLNDHCMCGSENCSECGTACTWCDGEGWDECTDPLQCCSEHKYDWCPCRACGGTGLRSTQRVF